MKNKILSTLLALTLGFSLVACGSKSDSKPENEKTEESESDSYQYNISALLSEDNTYDQILLQGFTDALSDYIGEEHFTITTSTVSKDTSSEDIANAAIASSPDMIFTTGKPTLQAATDNTDTIPIIATGIIDFKGTLHIPSLNGKSWDKTTGTNVTGISSKPSIVDQVSLMIEATDNLETVGILFSPEDTDAIYQNEIFEAYLDQAGIPWKEYLIPATNTTIKGSEGHSSIALSPSKFVAFSAKEGMDNTVEPLGDDTILGLNSPSSTRVALVSEFWTGGKTKPKTDDDESDTDTKSNDEEDSASSEETDTEEKIDVSEEYDSDTTIEERIADVCDECSVIYVPFGSMLTDQMDSIGKVAEESDVVIVAGDTQIGESALVTLFSDPYSLGYDAGKKAVRVFNGDDIATIKIGYGDSDDSIKLYNGEIAKEFGIEFPKSFSEFNEFLSSYKYGSNTARYSLAE